ncbi:hypothetical protein [Treponema endosymbiont of Eucomonympha sp.]|uniref:hypothetical protein n=1 Tax=Treponema endosymbiont of Eucomonympha sp. TaxID=1580831 RepID=UPI000AD58470|nr:hypothetical protein [Treponema endosymbiont of Eucomonympha sp.]
MRYYIVVEGASGEPKIYPHWIQYTNSKLVQLSNLNDNRGDAYYLVSGYGYPNYLKIIENAIQDVNNINNFNYLVVAIDSEDNTYQEKYDEVKDLVADKLESAELKIIVQYFCIETWALGNRIACRRNTQDKVLLEYKNIHDVRKADPELLPSYKEMNRAQFAFSYLKCMLHDWYPNAMYTKSNPKALLSEDYFNQIKKRFGETGHISSFRSFLDTFQ